MLKIWFLLFVIIISSAGLFVNASSHGKTDSTLISNVASSDNEISPKVLASKSELCKESQLSPKVILGRASDFSNDQSVDKTLIDCYDTDSDKDSFEEFVRLLGPF